MPPPGLSQREFDIYFEKKIQITRLRYVDVPRSPGAG